MIPVGETYRSPFGASLSQILAALILGLVASALAAGLIWLWEISPVPTLLLLTSILQGLILGGLLSFVIHRLRLPSRGVAFGIGLVCGLVSIALVYLAHYGYFALREVPNEIAAEPALEAEQKQVLLALQRAAPFRFADEILKEETGRGGPLGYLKLRANVGEQVGKVPLTGMGLWGLWVFEGLFVVFVTAGMASSKAAQPFCQDCRAWCEKNTGLPTFPDELTPSLVEAIRDDTPTVVEELRKQRLLVSDGQVVNLILHACPHCEQSFLDLTRTVGSGNQQKTVHLLKLARISPEMVATLRGPAVVPEPTAIEIESEPPLAIEPEEPAS